MADTARAAVAHKPALVPTFVATIGGIEQTCVDARFLHAYLQNGDHFAGWINARLQKYKFEEGTDYECVSQKTETQRAKFASGITEAKPQANFALEKTKAKNPGSGGHNKKDYRISLDMAKELSMVENNDRGREARRYFIDMERVALGQAAAPAPTMRPATPPNAAREQLNAADMQNIKRLIWDLSSRMHYSSVWVQAIWAYLRQALNHPGSQPFYADQLPQIKQELANVLGVGLSARRISEGVERDAARRIFRRGELASFVLPLLESEAQANMQRLTSGLAREFLWIEGDLQNLLNRTPPYMGVHYCADEQPDFFLQAA